MMASGRSPVRRLAMLGPAGPSVRKGLFGRGDGLAYVSARTGGLLVVDVSNPSQPVLVRSLLAGVGDVADARIGSGKLWVAAGTSGAHVYDLADPRDPVHISQAFVEDRALGVEPIDGGVVVTAGRGGVVQFRLAGGVLEPIRRWTIGGVAERAVRLGSTLFVAAEIGGLQAVRVDD